MEHMVVVLLPWFLPEMWMGWWQGELEQGMHACDAVSEKD